MRQTTRYQDLDLEENECAECGHTHFDAKTRTYSECPVCLCPLNDNHKAAS